MFRLANSARLPTRGSFIFHLLTLVFSVDNVILPDSTLTLEQFTLLYPTLFFQSII